MKEVIRKVDIMLIAFLIAAGLLASFYLSMTSSGSGNIAKVSIDGKVYGTYRLNENKTIDLKTGNVLEIKDGSIYMKSADCHGQDCVHQGKISKPSQTTVCLPHKVIVEIKGGTDEFDTISK